jgi:hypothetical protein
MGHIDERAVSSPAGHQQLLLPVRAAQHDSTGFDAQGNQRLSRFNGKFSGRLRR